jgi:Prokaryotic membrane lipoprotein lipid attachment site
MRRTIVTLVAIAVLTGCALAAAAGYFLFVSPLSANRAFTEIQLGAPRASVIATMGEPRMQVEPGELTRYSDCEIDETSSAQAVDLWVKGFDMLFLVGYSDELVVAKCSAAW